MPHRDFHAHARSLRRSTVRSRFATAGSIHRHRPRSHPCRGAARGRGIALTVNDVELADFNHDGRLDAVFAYSGNFIRVCLDDGDLDFRDEPDNTICEPINPLELTGSANELRVADLNRDGHVDIAAAHSSISRVYPGDGAGGFGAAIELSAATGISASFLVIARCYNGAAQLATNGSRQRGQ